MTILLLLIGLILFIALVVVHEFGHFVMARRNGVEVEEFGIGFPPALWKKRVKSDKGDYDFTINALPLGGFVKLKGEHDSDTEKGTFGAATVAAKTKIMVAGVIMNLITAFVLFTLLALIGMPKLVSQDNFGVDQFTVASDTEVTKQVYIITGTEPGSPAEKAGIKAYDEFISIGPVGAERQPIADPSKLSELTRQLAGQQAEIEYRRDGETKTAQLQVRSAEEIEASKNEKGEPTKGYIGLYQPSEYQLRRSTWSAPIVALGVMKQFTELTLNALGSALKGLGSIIAGTATNNAEARREGQKKASEQVSGPVGIFFVLKAGSDIGLIYVLMIIAVISLTLAIMNVLPIPALDGGRLFLLLGTRAVGKPLSARAEELVNGIGFASLMVLFLLITVVDVKRFF